MSIPRDVVDFLEGYPDVQDSPDSQANFQFYTNQRTCSPDNRTIDQIHAGWFGKYETLERRHGFIQWLFPIREYGMNWQSQPLQLHEIEQMRDDPLIVARIVGSYKLMLDFYGMQLVDEPTGLLARTEGYEERYDNLIHSSHNYLRISRILKCLSEMGLERLNAGFLLFVLAEQSEFGELATAGLTNSMDRWWANCLRDEGARRRIRSVIRQVRGGQLVYTRAMYEADIGSSATITTAAATTTTL